MGGIVSSNGREDDEDVGLALPPSAPKPSNRATRIMKAALPNKLLSPRATRVEKPVPEPVPDMRRVSSMYDADALLAKSKAWMATQTEKLSNTQDWQLLFDNFCKEVGKEELTFYELNDLFVRFGTRVNRPMLQLLFSLFDANGNGVVDRHEFLVAVSFLSQATETGEQAEEGLDIVDLAYFLFDTNRGGTISRREFNNMCLVLVNKAKFVLAVSFLRQAFRDHLTRNLCAENLDFYEAVEQLVWANNNNSNAGQTGQAQGKRKVKAARPSLLDIQSNKTVQLSLPTRDVERIYADFISNDATRQVNVSSQNRSQVEKALAAARESGASSMDFHVLDSCVNEIVGLMESDAMPRFKEEIKHTLADRIWKEESLGPDENMDRALFREWAEKHPGMFSFLEELRDTLLRAQRKQLELAATRIQRAFRKSKGRVYVLGVVQQIPPPTE